LSWKAFHSAHGIAAAATARGVAWGDAVGVALANNLGPLPGQMATFGEDAAHGAAIHGASLTSQLTARSFQNEPSPIADAASQVELVGVAAPIDHVIM
jgi:hypothetical protein